MFLVDSHCHLDRLSQSDDALNQIITRAKTAGVHHFLNVCITIQEFPVVLATAEKYPFVSASVGLHPNEQSETVDAETLLSLARHDKVVAIGETGLDYFRSKGDLTWQKDRFRMHIRVAHQLHLPLIVHTRAAKEDTIQIMKEEGAEQVGGVMHCFTEDLAMAKQALDMNFYVSFSGIITFKNATAIQGVAKAIPLDRLLIEPDSPYLAPDPHRGKPNEPAYVHYTAAYLAQLHQTTLENMAEQTTRNFFTVFKRAVKHV